MDTKAFMDAAVATLVAVAWKVAGAFLLWLAGRWLIVGNNSIIWDTIQNFSANPYRRVDLTATINNAVDHRDAIRRLKNRLTEIPHVLSTPAPDVEILQFTPAGPQLCVRPYCSNEHYWQVYFDTNRLIRESFGDAGYPPPMPGYSISSAWSGPPLDVTTR